MSGASPIHIGLVNNMAGAGFDAAEHRFCSLLKSAARDIRIRVSRFVLPGISHPQSYSTTDQLWDSGVDALIVTGREPRARRLQDELYWKSLTELVEWSQCNTHSVIWSCLAAHAAVLHLDGVERQPLQSKLFGVFESARQSPDPLLAVVPFMLRMPHSRWNDLRLGELEACGYRILISSAVAGADMFAKQQGSSQFVFFQGHPEYDSGTLILEYRRDIRRFLRGEQERHPSAPRGLAGKNTWRGAAVALYRNWLRCIASRKSNAAPELFAYPLPYGPGSVPQVSTALPHMSTEPRALASGVSHEAGR